MTNYSGVTKDFYFPYGQVYRMDLVLIVAFWRNGRLFFSKLETYLQTGWPEFHAVDDDLAHIDSEQGFIRLDQLKDTGFFLKRGSVK
jgi:hypothetical protein